MDKELKETVKSLAKSIKAMQAEISMLKHELIRSDNGNLPAGSQRSDLVPGILPAAKRRKTSLKETTLSLSLTTKHRTRMMKMANWKASRTVTDCQMRLGLLLRQRLCQSWTTLLGRSMLLSLAYPSLAGWDAQNRIWLYPALCYQELVTWTMQLAIYNSFGSLMLSTFLCTS